MNQPPFVTLIMPIRNEQNYIEATITAILAQTYPSDRLEILVVDGESDDGTQDYIKKTQEMYSYIHLINNPKKIVPSAMNLGIKHAKGDIIIRVDGHTQIAPDYIEQCVSALANTQADNVGGVMVAVGNTFWGKTVALATSSPFGVGGARFHYSNQSEWADTVYMGAWPKEIFKRIGLFDEEMVRNQDDELNYRLRKSGGRIWLSTKINSIYTPRGTWRSFYRQYYQYGFWKVRVLQKHPRQMRPRQFAPALFVLSLIGSIVLSPFFTISALWPMFYLLCATLASIQTARHHSWKYLLPLVGAFTTMHLAYGLGSLIGLIYFAKRWSDPRRQAEEYST